MGGGRVNRSEQDLDLLLAAEPLAQPADAPFRYIRRDDPPGLPGQHLGEGPMTRADLQHFAAEVRLDELEDPPRVVAGAVEIVQRLRQLSVCRRKFCAGSAALRRPSRCHRTTLPERDDTGPGSRRARPGCPLGLPVMVQGQAAGQQARAAARPQGLRAVSGRPWARELAVLAAYLAAGVAATWPLATYLTGRLPASRDVAIYVWDLWWVAHQLIHLHNPWFTSYMAAPVGLQLGYHTLVPLLGAADGPGHAGLRPVGRLQPADHRLARPGLLRDVPGGPAVAAHAGRRDRRRGVLRAVGHADLPGLVPPEHRVRHGVPAADPGGRRPAAPRPHHRPGRDPRRRARRLGPGQPGIGGDGPDPGRPGR